MYHCAVVTSSIGIEQQTIRGPFGAEGMNEKNGSATSRTRA
jgi:hypothetical protein